MVNALLGYLDTGDYCHQNIPDSSGKVMGALSLDVEVFLLAQAYDLCKLSLLAVNKMYNRTTYGINLNCYLHLMAVHVSDRVLRLPSQHSVVEMILAAMDISYRHRDFLTTERHKIEDIIGKDRTMRYLSSSETSLVASGTKPFWKDVVQCPVLHCGAVFEASRQWPNVLICRTCGHIARYLAFHLLVRQRAVCIHTVADP